MKSLFVLLIFVACLNLVASELPSYFTFARNKGCNADSCNKYSFFALNDASNSKIQVRDIVYQDGVNSTILEGANDNEVAVKGFFMTVMGPVSYFRVVQAYRFAPTAGKQAERGSFYFVERANLPCPNPKKCPGIRAVEINNNRSVLYNLMDLSAYDHIPMLDSDWLKSKVKPDSSPKAIIYGSIIRAEFHVYRIFVNINDPPEKCPPLPLAKCMSGSVTVYTRLPNRCFDFDGCTPSGACAFYLPECSAGYRLVKYPSKPHGCDKFKCEPDFLPIITISH